MKNISMKNLKTFYNSLFILSILDIDINLEFDNGLKFSEQFFDTAFSLTYLGSLMYIKEFEEITKDYKLISSDSKKIINNTKQLLDAMGANDPVSVFVIYMNLLYRGYFSKDKDFKYCPSLKDFHGLYEADIYSGIGVCRSIASFLDKIYDEYDFENSTFSVHAGTEAFDGEQHDIGATLKVERNSDSKNNISVDVANFIQKHKSLSFVSNHLINGVCYDGKSVFLDPTNNYAFKKIGSRQLSYLSENKERLLITDKNNGNVENNKKILSAQAMEKDIYEDLFAKGLEILYSTSEKLLEEFYMENKGLYHEVFEHLEDVPERLSILFPIPTRSRFTHVRK